MPTPLPATAVGKSAHHMTLCPLILHEVQGNAMAYRRRVVWTLLLVASLLGMLCTGATALARPRLGGATSASIVAKIIGGTETGPEPLGLPILNADFDDVAAAD